MRSMKETGRRGLCALLALALSVCCSFAGAESAGVFRVYVTDAEGEERMGVAIPLGEGVALTSAANVPEGATGLTLVDEDGNRDVLESEIIGTMALLAYEEEEATEEDVWPSWLDFAMPEAETLTVLTGDDGGNWVLRDVLSLSQMNWNGISSGVVTLSGPAELGSPLVTEDGCLAGMIAAEYAEGRNRYVFMTLIGMYLKILEEEDSEETETVPDDTVTDGGFVSAPIP